MLEPEILPADEAWVIYEGYVRFELDPHSSSTGRETIRASTSIPPQRRRLRLRYTQVLLSFRTMWMVYRYPLGHGAFFGQPVEQVSTVVEVSSPVELGALYSPTHQDDIMITRQDDRKATVSYEASAIYPDRDFELYIGARTEMLGPAYCRTNP